MTKSYNPHDFPPEIDDYFRFNWSNNLVDLAAGSSSVPLSSFIWQLDCPFWKTQKGCSYNLRPMEVLLSPNEFKVHFKRILDADVSFPLIVAEINETKVILDGLHRLASLYRCGVEILEYRMVDTALLGSRSISTRSN